MPSLTASDASTYIARNAAQLLSMSATGDSVASGGDYVMFGSITAQHAFASVAAAGDGWAHPVAGVYALTYHHEWDTYEGGGTIELEIDGVTSPAWLIADGVVGAEAFGTLLYVTTAESVGKIKVTQSSGSAQTCAATVQVGITDPAPDATAVEWERVFSADAWDIAWDGTYWYATEGDDATGGVTVTKHEADGTLVSSFEAANLTAARGITFDGTHLWVTGNNGGNDEPIRRYQTDGTYVTGFVTGPNTDGNAGLGWDGTDLWMYENNGNDVERWSTAGVMQSTFALVGTYQGVTYHGGYLYVVNRTAAEIVVLQTDGTQVDTIDVSGATNDPTGIWIMGDGTLYVSSDDDGVWRRLVAL